MLRELVDYAEKKLSDTEAGFKQKDVRWLIGVSADGRFTGLIPMDEGQLRRRCPDASQPELMAMPKALRALGHSCTQGAHFLADSCRVATGLKLEETTEPEAEASKFLGKHEAFALLILLASADLPELLAIHQVLQGGSEHQKLQDELLSKTREKGPGKLKETDRVSFLLQDLGCVLDWLPAQEWWRNFRLQFSEKSESESHKMVSLASGKLVTPASTHGKITQLERRGTGLSLVSYDKPAFESYGLRQGENGALSEAEAAAYTAGLDDLLRKARQLGDMRVTLWWKQAIQEEEDAGLFDALFEPGAEEGNATAALQRARELLDAIRSGKIAPRISEAQFYSLAVSPAAGRVVVRHWQTGSLKSLAEAVDAWFSDLTMVDFSGARLARLPGLGQLIGCLQRPRRPDQRAADYFKPVRSLELPLWRAALNPSVPIPRAALVKLMDSHRASVLSGALAEALGPSAQRGNAIDVRARMSLIKAYYNRAQRNQGGHQMSPALDPKHPSPAYHCGRLMRLLAQIQEAALGDVGAGVVQRYYGAASSTPSLVLGRLTRLSQAHLGRLYRDSGGLATWLERQVAEIWDSLGQDVPKTLNLEEQSLFALGYYHQWASSHGRKAVMDEGEGRAAPPDQTAPPETN
jgi:CRISPR-associated protein Csd1